MKKVKDVIKILQKKEPDGYTVVFINKRYEVIEEMDLSDALDREGIKELFNNEDVFDWQEDWECHATIKLNY
ncbi:MAG: hypothetical protein RR623_07565 [Bacilli bacterium]